MCNLVSHYTRERFVPREERGGHKPKKAWAEMALVGGGSEGGLSRALGLGLGQATRRCGQWAARRRVLEKEKEMIGRTGEGGCCVVGEAVGRVACGGRWWQGGWWLVAGGWVAGGWWLGSGWLGGWVRGGGQVGWSVVGRGGRKKVELSWYGNGTRWRLRMGMWRGYEGWA